MKKYNYDFAESQKKQQKFITINYIKANIKNYLDTCFHKAKQNSFHIKDEMTTGMEQVQELESNFIQGFTI